MADLPTSPSTSTADEPAGENAAGSPPAAPAPARRSWLGRSVILVLRTLGWFVSGGWVALCVAVLSDSRVEAHQLAFRIVVGVFTLPWVVVWIVLWRTRRDTDRAGAAAILTVGLWIAFLILVGQFG